MAIRKRTYKSGKVSWQLDYFDPDGNRVRKSFKLKKDAEAYRDRVGVDIREGVYEDPKKYLSVTFGDLCSKYHENFKDQASYKTAKVWFIIKFKDFFGEQARLVNIRYLDIETYRNTLKRTPVTKLIKGERVILGQRQDASVNREISTLHHMFRKAVEWEMLRQSPFDKGKSLFVKENNGHERFLTEEEARRLLENCPVHLRHIVLFTLHTGARKKEVLGLKWTDIRDDHVWFTDTKTGTKDKVPLDDEVKALLGRLRDESGPGNVVSLKGDKVSAHRSGRYVFTYFGKRVASVNSSFLTACKAAGIPYGRKVDNGITFHTLRHTFISWLVQRGVPLKVVQELARHKEIKMTMRYAHLQKGACRDAVQLLSGATTVTQVSREGFFGEKNARNARHSDTQSAAMA